MAEIPQQVHTHPNPKIPQIKSSLLALESTAISKVGKKRYHHAVQDSPLTLRVLCSYIVSLCSILQCLYVFIPQQALSWLRI